MSHDRVVRRGAAVAALAAIGLMLSGCSAADVVGADAGVPLASPSSTPEPNPAPAPAPRTPSAPATPSVDPGSDATPEADPEGPVADTTPRRARTPTPDPEPEPEPELVAGPPIWGIGSQGDEVRELQARLRQIAWFDRDPTGYYGDVTSTAVSGFQGKRGFPVVGYVDQRTWDRIVSMTFAPTEDELYPPPPEPPEPDLEAAAPPVPGLDERCVTGRAICVDKATSVVRWVVDGRVLLTMDARFGSELLPTREGLFSVQRKVRDEYSRLYDDAPMPFAVYFSGGQAVHYSPDFATHGYNGSSHGCVNTRDWNGMSSLFDAANIGDKVVVYWS